MEFRPCIDIHNGKVKQIVGSSLKDEGNQAIDNYVSEYDAGYYASLYKQYGLKGGHLILLNKVDSQYYDADVKQALLALDAYPGAIQVGGGVHDGNADFWIAHGASHVIVTSYVFSEGKLKLENLKKLVRKVGAEHIVLDVSCRKKDGNYYIVTDRWQKFTDVVVNRDTLSFLSEYCDELLVHGVDVEGKASGIDKELLQRLSEFSQLPITYAGGIRSMEDISYIRDMGKGKIHFTIGSALDLFGGHLSFKTIAKQYGHNE